MIVETHRDLPPETPAWHHAAACVARLKRAGFNAWFVGGAVRDLLLDRPVHDIDVCSDAAPEDVERLFPRAIGVGRAFGVMVVPHGDGLQTEIASFRSDAVYIDGRRPSGIRAASEAEDVERRDFTINALLMDPVSGLIRDHVGGLEDLAQRRLRAIGVAADRLHEDRLRVLRGWRFAAHLDLELEAATRAAMEMTDLSGISAERLLQEWKRGLAHERGWRWWNTISSSPQSGYLAGPGDPLPATAWSTAIAADPILGSVRCLIGRDPAEVEELLRRLPWSREERRLVSELHAACGRRHDGGLQRLRDQHASWSPAAAALIASIGDAPDWLASWASERDRHLPVLADGRRLQELGVPPGPAMGVILERIRDAQLCGHLEQPEQLPAFVALALRDRDAGAG